MYGTTVHRVDIKPKFIIFIFVETNNNVQPTTTNNTEHQLQTSTKTITLSSRFLFFDPISFMLQGLPVIFRKH